MSATNKLLLKMKFSDKTTQQIQRALKKAASKFENTENMPLTDLILHVKQESGELLVLDDNDKELTRCVVEEWLGNTSELFYEEIQPTLKEAIHQMKEVFENIPILKPYSIMLTGEDGETIAELFIFDDDLLVLDGLIMEGLSDDLENFWEELSKK